MVLFGVNLIFTYSYLMSVKKMDGVVTEIPSAREFAKARLLLLQSFVVQRLIPATLLIVGGKVLLKSLNLAKKVVVPYKGA